MEQREFVVEQETAGQRIDRFLSGEDTGLSRSALQALVADGHVQCNGKAVAKSLKLKAGDTVLLEIPDAKPIEAVPQDIPLDIVYEDDDLLVINKPKGLVVHPAAGHADDTLVNGLLYALGDDLSGINGELASAYSNALVFHKSRNIVWIHVVHCFPCLFVHSSCINKPSMGEFPPKRIFIVV